ncbi:MAG: hypothetical protein A2096_00135 [Spirochaetes bacterium GWF1_41_5]|nr:MAG: hypothetical protein A2096_00135 [Spirochaetes bacterium GWF1_41_5]
MSTKISWAAISSQTASQTGIPLRRSAAAIKKYLELLKEDLLGKNRCRMKQLGSLHIKRKAARRSYNPASGGYVDIPARNAVRYLPGSAVKKLIIKSTGYKNIDITGQPEFSVQQKRTANTPASVSAIKTEPLKKENFQTTSAPPDFSPSSGEVLANIEKKLEKLFTNAGQAEKTAVSDRPEKTDNSPKKPSAFVKNGQLTQTETAEPGGKTKKSKINLHLPVFTEAPFAYTAVFLLALILLITAPFTLIKENSLSAGDLIKKHGWEYKIQKNDTLPAIAFKCYGDEKYWPLLFVFNRDTLVRPEIPVGIDEIKIPALAASSLYKASYYMYLYYRNCGLDSKAADMLFLAWKENPAYVREKIEYLEEFRAEPGVTAAQKLQKYLNR